MKQPTHFIEQYSRKPEFAKLIGREDNFTAPIPIKFLSRMLTHTAGLNTYYTVAIWFITPKKA